MDYQVPCLNLRAQDQQLFLLQLLKYCSNNLLILHNVNKLLKPEVFKCSAENNWLKRVMHAKCEVRNVIVRDITTSGEINKMKQ